ncbi:hypothetical protein WJX72_004859 [[Myrmecia] bisecta]|uniref:Uncharacterized protein n=1 Tax=[Myrmecia] bisecta TaxID=41462 RepID=A0AAW1R6V8_9CHLO
MALDAVIACQIDVCGGVRCCTDMYDTPAYSVLHWREQCVLDNARVLWQRVVDQTRRDVDEHAEQLKNLANLAALTAGFAMSSFLQFSFDNNASQPGVLIAFGVTASLVAALDFIAMCLCNLMLACILKVAEDNVNEEQEAHFVLQCREFALRYKPGDRPPAPRRTFRKYWDARCRAEWQWAFFFFWLSIPLFLINMGVSAWVKFSRRNTPALLMTVILGLALAYLAATHTRWVRHINSERSQKDVVIDVKPAGLPWDWHRLPHAYSLSITYSRPIEPAHNDVLPDAIGHDDETTEAVLARWRAEDMQQRTLDNARVLWKRFVDSIRNDVEECSEQLRSLSFLAGILDGFAMSSLLQLPVAASTSRVVINGYSVTLGITVALMTVAMAMSGMMTMSIVKSGAQLVAEKEEALFMAQCYEFAAGFRLGDRPPALRRNFRNHWEQRCEGEWRRAFYMFTVGLVVFQIHLCFAAWVKFPPPYQTTAVLMTIILGLGLVGLVIANLRWSRFSLGVSTKIGGGARHENSALWVTPLRPVGLPFDWHLPPYTVLLHSPVHQHNGKAPSQAPSSGEDPGLADVWPYSGQMREEIVEQQHLNNARVLWERFASKNLTDLEERQEQLRIVVELSAVIAGFEMIAFLQFGFDTHATNYGLQLSYAVTSALTVALSSCSMTMCGLIMESILETGSAYLSPSAEADYMMRCREWVAGYQLGDRPPEPKRNFRNHWDRQCEDEWRRAFYMFSLSVPLYLINSAISAWIKWQTLRAPPAISSSVLGLAVLYLLLGHARWVRHLLGFEHVQVSKELSLPAGLPFDWHANPKPVPSSQRRRGSLNTPANGSSRSMATASSLSGV